MMEYKDTEIGYKEVMFMYTVSSYLPPNPIPYIYISCIVPISWILQNNIHLISKRNSCDTCS